MSMYGPVFNLIAPFVLASSGRPHPADVRQQDSVRDGAAPHHPGHTPGGQGAGVWPVAGPAQADVPGHAHGPPVLLPGRPPQPEVRHHRGVQEQPDEEGTHPVLRVPIFRYTPSVLPSLPYSIYLCLSGHLPPPPPPPHTTSFSSERSVSIFIYTQHPLHCNLYCDHISPLGCTQL